jgi:uncharacterized phage protein gp47/JayE
MTTYGLTTEGFVIKPLEVIKAEREADLKTAFGSSINLASRSGFGQLVGIFSEREALLWELAQEVHSAFDPDAATGDSLSSLSALTGTLREGATKSTVTLTALGTAGTLLSAGRVVSVVTLGTKFETTEDATILALTAWAINTAYTVGQRVTNSSKAYECITAGTSAGSGGPTTTSSDITDNTAHWKYLGSSTGAVDVAAEAQETGPLPALAGTLTEIETPVGGWASVTNLLDATLGQDEESDTDLRTRRADEVAGEGNATIDAIRRGVLAVDGVSACYVFQNVTLTTDGDGIPGKAVEVLVQGGADQDIIDAIFAEVAGGIETHGTESGTATDSAGNEHTIEFSRADEVEIYVIADVVKVADEFPADGSDQVKAAIVDYGDTYPIGKDVYANALRARIFAIDGVLNVTNLKIGTAPTPTLETTITITSRQRATFDTSRVTVNVSNGTP